MTDVQDVPLGAWRLWAGLRSLAAPAACLACTAPLAPSSRQGSWEAALCRACRLGVERSEGACRRCGAPSVGAPAPDGCLACPPQRGHVTSVTALLRYRGPARAVVTAVKYRGRDRLALPLGRALAARFLAREPAAARDPDLLVVPVPLHALRRWRRGFNQAQEVAAGVGEVLARPTALALVRRRATRALYGVRRGERAAVISGAFAVPSGCEVAGRPVALVDDIRTSGATLREAARVLAAAGAARIDALVVAC